MLRHPRRVKSFTGIGWGEVASVALAGGPTYHELAFETSLTPAQLERATLFLNGEPVIELSGEQMKMLERYKKHFEQEGMFILPIGDISGRSLEGQAASALVTFPTDNLTVEIKIKEAPNPSDPPPLPSLRADAWVSGSSDRREVIPRIRTITFTPDATGENIINTLSRGPEIRRIHMRNSDGGSPAACGIEHLRVLRDRLTVFELSAKRNEFELQRRERATQELYYHFDPVMSGFNKMDRFSTQADELEWKLEMNNTNVVRMLVEQIERAAETRPGAES